MGIAVTKRTGGYTIQINSKLPIYASSISYYSTPNGVKLLLPGQVGELLTDAFTPADWTIQTVTGFTTNLQVVDALDLLGLASGDTMDDMKALLTTIDADTGAIKTAAESLSAGQGDGSQKTQAVMVSGVSTGGTTATLVDNTKFFEGGSLIGKILKFAIDSIEYFKEITNNIANTINFSPINEGQFSTAVVGDIGAGQVTILTATKGDFNDYTVEFVAGVGNNVPLSAAFAGGVLTVTLATDENGDLNAVAENFASNIADVIHALPEFTALMTGAGGIMGVTAVPVPFSGGVDPVIIPAGLDYQIIYDTLDAADNQINGSQKTQVVDSAGVGENPVFRVFNLTLIRPANQTVYAAGDVIGDVSAALTKFVNVAKAAGYGVVITNIRLQTNDTGLAGKVINLHFYSDTVDPIADNAAFALSDANAPKRRGMIAVTFGTGALGKVAQAHFENLIVVPVSRDIPVILETVAGFTPSANSTWIRVEIGVILGN